MFLDYDNEKYSKNDSILSRLKTWENNFPSKAIFVNRGKKTKHSLQIIASLALCGPSTTREMAKFVIRSSSVYNEEPKDKDSRIVEQTFLRLIEGREKKESGRKKYSEKYPGLESNYYVMKTGTKINNKGKEVNLYSLTFPGFLFALGFDFKDKEFVKLLDNAEQHHILFAYIKRISENSSIQFVKKIFLNPMIKLIQENRIPLEDSISFYFSNIIESFGRSLDGILEVYEHIDDDEDVEKIEFIEEIIKWTFYDDRPTSDWYNAMIDIFYPDDKKREFFLLSSNTGLEENLLFKTMQKIHLVYFGYGGSYIPRRTQKIPVSKKWNELKKYHPQYKNPRDHDRKRKIRIRYDADHIPDGI